MGYVPVGVSIANGALIRDCLHVLRVITVILFWKFVDENDFFRVN